MIYIIRHGQTDWNAIGRCQGRIDIELNEHGINQAKEIHNKLENVKFDKVFSSPLKRALKTVQIITNEDIIIDNRIIERCIGVLEGKLQTEIEINIDFNKIIDDELGIEQITDFKGRIFNFFEEIQEKYKGKNVLVVTHAGVSIYARCFFEGEPVDGNYNNYKLKNCEILMYNND